MTTLDALSAALQAFCREHGLPQMSADELCVGDSFSLTDTQRAFLEAFVECWDAAQP